MVSIGKRDDTLDESFARKQRDSQVDNWGWNWGKSPFLGRKGREGKIGQIGQKKRCCHAPLLLQVIK
jgi:hypothetical protein